MYRPYRVAAPPPPDAPEGPDPFDAYERKLRVRARRSRRMLPLAGVMALGAFLAFVNRPRPDHHAEHLARLAARTAHAEAAFSAARELLGVEQSRFEAVVNESATQAVPREGASCPIEVNHVTFPLLVTSENDRDLPSPSVGAILSDVRRGEALLGLGRTADALLYANALDIPRLRYDVVLLTSTAKHPVRTTADSFEPGEVTGRAYLYDFKEHRVRCAGAIHVVSSTKIEYSFIPGAAQPAALDQGPSLTASLDRDLEEQTRHAIVSGGLFALD